jgi:hypothetical protein
MKEQEQSTPTTPTEQIRQNLLDQLKAAEFGSATFRAASDYFALSYQRNLMETERDKIFLVGSDQKKRIHWESETRIRETQIALLEREIESNKSRVPGYSKAYMNLLLAFDHLGTLTHEEAKNKYPSDEEKRKQYGKDLYRKIHDEINDLIYVRQDQS